jgi:hypothetical protein
MLTNQACFEDNAVGAVPLPAGSRGFPCEPFMNFFEALFASFPVFVAGIHPFHHDPAPLGILSVSPRPIRPGYHRCPAHQLEVKRYESRVKADV